MQFFVFRVRAAELDVTGFGELFDLAIGLRVIPDHAASKGFHLLALALLLRKSRHSNFGGAALTGGDEENPIGLILLVRRRQPGVLVLRPGHGPARIADARTV